MPDIREAYLPRQASGPPPEAFSFLEHFKIEDSHTSRPVKRGFQRGSHRACAPGPLWPPEATRLLGSFKLKNQAGASPAGGFFRARRQASNTRKRADVQSNRSAFSPPANARCGRERRAVIFFLPYAASQGTYITPVLSPPIDGPPSAVDDRNGSAGYIGITL